MLFGYSIQLMAQSQTIVVKPNEALNDKLDKGIQYALPEFSYGVVYFKDGSEARGSLNYNYLSSTLQFDDNGVIKDVVGQNNILMVDIGQTRFVPAGKGLAEIIFDGDEISLLRNRRIVQSDKKSAGYGGKSSTSAVQNVSSYSSSGSTSGAGSNAAVTTDLATEVEFKRIDEFFLLKALKTTTASKSGFYKYFPDLKPEIDKFISENNVDFSSENDIKQLFIFLIGLQNK